MKVKTLITLILLTTIFSACNLVYWSEGQYSVTPNAGDARIKTLYRDLESGSGIGRVNNVTQIGSNDTYIIVESTGNRFWVLNKEKDTPNLNGNEIVVGPMNKIEFIAYKKELGIETLSFSHQW